MAQNGAAGEPQRKATVRTATILGLVALVCFGSIIAAQFFPPFAVGVVTLGVTAAGFLLAAIRGQGRA
jgi:hypothetical protein